jgi:hypothetical protein
MKMYLSMKEDAMICSIKEYSIFQKKLRTLTYKKKYEQQSNDKIEIFTTEFDMYKFDNLLKLNEEYLNLIE